MIDLDLLANNWEKLLRGTLLTLELVGVSVALGGLIALPVALARLSGHWWLRTPAYLYVLFFRGTPLLAQIYLLYYGSGQFRGFFESIGLWGVLREAYWCALIAFTINTAAYTAEILRGGIQSVPHGEIEAARACGMSGLTLYRRIILPRAYRLALPAYGNEIIFMLKGSTLASVITLFELMGWTRAIYARTFDMEIYVYAAVIYLVLTWAIGRGVRALEWWLSPDLRPIRH